MRLYNVRTQARGGSMIHGIERCCSSSLVEPRLHGLDQAVTRTYISDDYARSGQPVNTSRPIEASVQMLTHQLSVPNDRPQIIQDLVMVGLPF